MSYDKPKCHAYLECELWFENVSDETIRGDIFIEYKTIDSALNTKIVESPNDFRSLRRAVIDIGDKHKATTKLGVKLSGFYKLEFRSICIGDKTYNMPFEVNVNFTRTKKFRLLTDRKHIMKFDVEITEGESLISEWETSL
ncbi:MAG: hypothetical protein COA69_04830 [Robiginitomaculum sp.]|nr:MAG: hypothetical protein COA69_04830 [Robiginitomaculum sp.]